jgi:hypothetical protein
MGSTLFVGGVRVDHLLGKKNYIKMSTYTEIVLC